MKKSLRIVKRTVLLCMLPLLAYAGAVVLLGLVPLNRDFTQAPAGVDIYLRANAVHADLLVPIRSVRRDWRTRLPDLPGLEHAEYLAVGWGDRAFYLETRNWSDLRPGNALLALSGLDSAVLHLNAEGRPQTGDETIRIRVSPEQLAQIMTQIDAAFVDDAAGRPIPIPGAAYGAGDRFYQAQGHYSLFFTCNEWARNVMSHAGLRTAAWAPLAPALLYQARQIAPAAQG